MTKSEVAEAAIAIAADLTVPQVAEVMESTLRDGVRRIPGRHRVSTEGALTRKGAVVSGTTELTRLGLVVHAVLSCGPDAVRTWAVTVNRAEPAPGRGGH